MDGKTIEGKITYGDWQPAAGGVGIVRDVLCCGEFVGSQADAESVTLFMCDIPDADRWMSEEAVFVFKSEAEFEKFIKKCEWTANNRLLEDGVDKWELTGYPGGHGLDDFFEPMKEGKDQ